MFDKRRFSLWVGAILVSSFVLGAVRLLKEQDSADSPAAVIDDPAQWVWVDAIDGDTLTTVIEGKAVTVRLFGVDAPEETQPFGDESEQFISTVIAGSPVRIEVVDTDRYGRLVARVYLADGTNLSELIVRRGFGWWYQTYAPHDTALSTAEAEARHERLGLWNVELPVPPWEFRRAGGAP
jgi:micrococcal nuclease